MARMSKAILVMDMPDNCTDCPIHKTTGLCIPGIDADLHEWFDRGSLSLIETPDWCPLVPMPEQQPALHDSSEDDYVTGWNDGWNACLDEIEGGNDNG